MWLKRRIILKNKNMTAEVKILIEGYTGIDNLTGQERTQSTITLVKDKDIIMVVDPGVLPSQQVLIDKLAEENLQLDDVNYVFITHSHLDHYRNVGMFVNAKVIEYFGVWDKNRVEDRVENLTENLRILVTPGHDYTALTLFVNTEQGVVAICGDVFWQENKPEVDPYAKDLTKLNQSRQMILQVADFVIPGHGAMYKVKERVFDTQEVVRDNIKKISNYSFNKIKIASKIFSTNILASIKNKLIIKRLGNCKKCGNSFKKIEDKCVCQTQFCFRCCECDIDCDLCNCKHKIK
ncbi:MAG: Metallo-beta-lactamase [Parcubacteria group bacterium GW2011_GWC2_32_10]|nr:MAG: Metallo-beta-lactamase [Parcubacteria group bacterium GW2011_GWC2_32_10]